MLGQQAMEGPPLVLAAGSVAWPCVPQAVDPPDEKREGKQRTYRPWTVSETAALTELVAFYGANTKHWGTIARHLPGRSSKQCRDRWLNFAADGINTDKWTTQEDLRIAAHHARNGPAWAKLSQVLNGRTQLAIKNRWHSTLRARGPQSSRTVLQAYINALKAGRSVRDAYAAAYKLVTGSDEPGADLGAPVRVKAEAEDERNLPPTGGDCCLLALDAAAATTPDHSPASADGTESTYQHEANSRTASPLPMEADSGCPLRCPQRRHPADAASSPTSPSTLSPSPPVCVPPIDIPEVPSISSLDASCSSHFSTHPPSQPHRASSGTPTVAAAPSVRNPLLRHAPPPPADNKRFRSACEGAAFLLQPPFARAPTALPLPHPSPFFRAQQAAPTPANPAHSLALPYAAAPPLHIGPHTLRQPPAAQQQPPYRPQAAPLQVRGGASQLPAGDAGGSALMHELALLYSQGGIACDPFSALGHSALAAPAGRADTPAPAATARWSGSELGGRATSSSQDPSPRLAAPPRCPTAHPTSCPAPPAPRSTSNPGAGAQAPSSAPRLMSAPAAHAYSTHPSPALCAALRAQRLRPDGALRDPDAAPASHATPRARPATPSHAPIRSGVTLRPSEAERQQAARRHHHNLASALFGQHPAALSQTLAAAASGATMGPPNTLARPLGGPAFRPAAAGPPIIDPLAAAAYCGGDLLHHLLAGSGHGGHPGDLQAALAADLDMLTDAEMQELLLMTL